MQLHEIIKGRRLELGLPQKKVALDSGITEANYIKIEQGKASPKWNTLLAIFEVLGLRWSVKG